MKIFNEFKVFISRGNAIDLAIGIVVGAAFGKIISSLVNDILMPPLGLLIGGVNFSSLAIVLKQATVDAVGKSIAAVAINYGVFLQAIFDFIIIAFCLFLIVKAVNALRAPKKEEAPPQPDPDILLLTEIRDLLKK